MLKTLEQVAKESAKNSRMPLTTQGGYIFEEGFIAGAEHIKKEYEEKLRWISAEEKLPNENGRYLTRTRNGYINILSYESSMWSTMGYQSDITHWIPISFL